MGRAVTLKSSYELHGDSITHYKREAIRAAKDLGYGEATVDKIRNAGSVVEVSIIMKTRRKELMED